MIPTAEEFLRKNIDYVLSENDCKEDVENAMKEFAKLHVEACKKAQEIYIDKYGQLEEGYDEAYPLTNIK
jgi:hypothetical protein